MLNLTPDIVSAIYELLRLTPPFRRWKLPHADEIEFHITIHKDRHADTLTTKGKHRIRVSNKICRTLETATMAIAHEMCHIRQWHLGAKKENHGKVFNHLANQVCRHHQFDRGTF